jgi:hypothetical protein
MTVLSFHLHGSLPSQKEEVTEASYGSESDVFAAALIDSFY